MAFLVMCAAWTTLAAVDARVSENGAAADDGRASPTLTLDLTRNNTIEREKITAFRAEHGPTSQLIVRVEDGVSLMRLAAVLDVAQGLGYSPPAVEPL